MSASPQRGEADRPDERPPRRWRPLDRGTGQPSALSSERSFAPRLGARVGRPERPRGYYIDFSLKPRDPQWPPRWLPRRSDQLHIAVVQWALGAWERHIAGEQDRPWRAAVMEAADHLMAHQQRGGARDGAWLHWFPMPHTYRIAPPWTSAIAQGEAASLFVRLYHETGEERYADTARRALRPLFTPVTSGGVLAEPDGLPFFEEYPTDPPSLVLNGAMFALWGLHDVARALGDGEAEDWWMRGIEGMLSVLDGYDTGYWSRYDLYPHAVNNVASSAYHLLHINQLGVTGRLSERPEFDRLGRRFEDYRRSRRKRVRAFVTKVGFRLLSPRNRLLAHRLPTSAGRGRGDLVILCYHAISTEWRSSLSVTPAQLEAQVRRMLDRGYRPANVTDAVLAPRAGKTFAVTFDDAYESVGKLAAPVLARLGVPATVFVPTAFAGSPEPMSWPGIDQVAAGPHAHELLPLSWEGLAALANSGWEIGSHTRSHPRLTELDDEQLLAELSESRLECERRLGRPCRSLAYPYGGFDDRVVQAAAAAGYAAACALPPPFPDSENLLAVPRIGVYGVDSPIRFHLKVSPAVRRLRRGPAAALFSIVARRTATGEGPADRV